MQAGRVIQNRFRAVGHVAINSAVGLCGEAKNDGIHDEVSKYWVKGSGLGIDFQVL